MNLRGLHEYSHEKTLRCFSLTGLAPSTKACSKHKCQTLNEFLKNLNSTIQSETFKFKFIKIKVFPKTTTFSN